MRRDSAARSGEQISSKMKAFDAICPAPFGGVGVRTREDSLAELIFLHSADAFAPVTNRRSRLADEVCDQIAAYLADPDFRFELPLEQCGTDFQRRVWSAISDIPCGHTRGYGRIAQLIGSAPRAVGQACGANRFPLVIPCHRVVSAAGIGGFAHHAQGFHLNVKRWLLLHETK